MKPHNNLPSDEHNLSTLSRQSLPIIPACLLLCLCSARIRKQQRTPGISKFCWSFNTVHTVSYCTVLDKDPKHLTRLPPSHSLKSTCSITLITQSSQGTNGSRDKWGRSQRSSENNGSERRGNELHKELLAQLSSKVSLFLNGAVMK